MQIGQVDIPMARSVELALQRLARVEAVHGRAIAAAGDILADIALGDGGVGQVCRRVVALAEVEDVGGVEVVQAEVLGEGVDGVVDFLLHRVGDVVEEGDDGVGGFGGGGVEDVLADARGVELGGVDGVSCWVGSLWIGVWFLLLRWRSLP